MRLTDDVVPSDSVLWFFSYLSPSPNMKSETTTRNSRTAPMSKRTVFTTITPLPPHISREAVVAFLHDYEGMIDINPLVTDRHPIPPPDNAEPDEATCTWYQLTDAVAMPWSSSSSPHAAAASQRSGNVSYTCVFHPLPDGLQTHCRAPLGVDIRDRWTVGGNAPGEPQQRLELGLDAIGAPASGLYLREDVDLRCNRLMSGFVKKTLKKSHGALVEKLSSDLAGQETATTTNTAATATAGPANRQIERRRSTDSVSMMQAPLPVSWYGSTPSSCSPQHAQPTQYKAFQPPSHQLHQLQQEQQPAYRPYQDQHSRPYSYQAPPPQQRAFVPAVLAVGPPRQQQQQRPHPQPQPPPWQSQQAQQSQNQQYQRSLHPLFPQPREPSNDDEPILVDLTSLSTSPSLSFTSVSTSASVSTAPSSTSSEPTQYSRFRTAASPLTQLQHQLPKAAPKTRISACGVPFTEEQRRHSSHQYLGTPTGSLPDLDPALCPQPLRVGLRSVSASQPAQQHRPVETQKPTEPVEPAQQAVAHPDYPFMNPYDDDDEWEDEDVTSPILAAVGLSQRRGVCSPTIFAEMDGAVLGAVSGAADVDAKSGTKLDTSGRDAGPASEWLQWRRLLVTDLA